MTWWPRPRGRRELRHRDAIPQREAAAAGPPQRGQGALRPQARFRGRVPANGHRKPAEQSRCSVARPSSRSTRSRRVTSTDTAAAPPALRPAPVRTRDAHDFLGRDRRRHLVDMAAEMFQRCLDGAAIGKRRRRRTDRRSRPRHRCWSPAPTGSSPRRTCDRWRESEPACEHARAGAAGRPSPSDPACRYVRCAADRACAAPRPRRRAR
jgi:hypothetical protein